MYIYIFSYKTSFFTHNLETICKEKKKKKKYELFFSPSLGVDLNFDTYFE